MEARAQFVAGAGANDDELRKELIALLKASDGRTDSGDAPIVNLSDLFPAESRSFSDGEPILDRFRIVRYVGGGGMGEVYEAIDLEMGRIAFKTIRPDIASNPGHALAVQKGGRARAQDQWAACLPYPCLFSIDGLGPTDQSALS